MNEQDYYRRLDQFDGPIRELAGHNPIVSRVITSYAAGEIITKEEALCKMVVLLAQNWKEIQESHMRLLMDCARPIIKPIP